MSLTRKFYSMFATARTYDPVHPKDPALARIFGATNQNAAKATVNSDTVIGLPAVKRAVEILANGMMNKQCQLMEIRESGNVPDKTHATNNLLRKVNRNMLFSDWVNLMQSWVCLYGNAVSAIESDAAGNIELIPFLPDRTQLVLASGEEVQEAIGRNEQLFYRTTINGQHVYRLPERVIHIQGAAGNGYWGLNPIEYLREVFGGDIATREHANRVFGQGAMPAGFITVPGTIRDEEAFQQYKESIQAATSGMGEAHKIAFIEEGGQFIPWTLNAKDTQMLERMEFNIKDIALTMGIQAAKLGVRAEQSYNSLEMSEQEHQSDDVQSWVTKWQDELSDKLLMPEEKGRLKFVFEYKNDWIPFKDKSESAVKLLHGTVATLNEARKLANLPPEQGGDIRIVPLNMKVVPVGDGINLSTEDSSAEMLGIAVNSALCDICRRLKKQAEGKIKDFGKFIEWVDSLETDQGADYLKAASVPMVEEFRDKLAEILQKPISKDEAIAEIGLFLSVIADSLPQKHAEKVLK